jgi:Tol biopolymer transport system component
MPPDLDGTRPGGLLSRLLQPLLLASAIVAVALVLHAETERQLAAAAPAPVAAMPPDMVPLTRPDSAMDGFADWSPDGSQIAFMRDGRIWTALPAPRQVTDAAESWDAVPRWFPDGKRVAFARLSLQDGSAQVIARSLQSGEEVELAREPEQIGYLAISPDGRDLVYSTKTRLVKLEGLRSRKTLLTAGAGVDMLPGGITFAPDGRELVFGFGERGNLNLYRMPAGGGPLVRLTREGGIMPAFGPGGRHLAYRRPNGRSGIWVFKTASGESRYTVPDERGALWFHPSYAPDGRSLLLSRLSLKREGPPSSHIMTVIMPGEGSR